MNSTNDIAEFGGWGKRLFYRPPGRSDIVFWDLIQYVPGPRERAAIT